VSDYPSEDEVLLTVGAQFQVVSVNSASSYIVLRFIGTCQSSVNTSKSLLVGVMNQGLSLTKLAPAAASSSSSSSYSSAAAASSATSGPSVVWQYLMDDR
jgi:hypothetical protein